MPTILEKLDVLRRTELLKEIRTESLARIAAIAGEGHPSANQVLYGEGQIADRFYLLLEGEVVTVSAERGEQRHRPGSLLGILEVLAEGAYFETARTNGSVRLLQVDQQDLLDIMASDFHLTRGLLRRLVHTLARRG